MSSNITGKLQRIVTKSKVKERISVIIVTDIFFVRKSTYHNTEKIVVENGGIFNPLRTLGFLTMDEISTTILPQYKKWWYLENPDVH